MRILAAGALAFALYGGAAVAQTTQSTTASPQFEHVTLGEPILSVRHELGDPVKVSTSGGQVIWRYLEHGGAIFLDLIVRNNTVSSVTVVRRFQSAAYTDARGASFGMTVTDTRAKLGAPARTTVNSDDGSTDDWYYAGQYAWIYEFYSGKLGFIQLLASPAWAKTFVSAVAVSAAGGTTVSDAIVIRPSNLITTSLWIDAYLAINPCGSGGTWKNASSTFIPDDTLHDPFGYTVVHAKCSDGATERDFFFDTHGMLSRSANGSQTIYVDPRELPTQPPR